MTDEIASATAQNAELAATLNDRWYPRFHIAAPAGWINDPNGLCFYQGRYQVYFQHHPASPQWGPMHWGHVSSADLVTWRREPIALAPSIEEDKDGVWSGSAVEADDGTLMAYYTGQRWRNGVNDDEGNLQMQCLATSTDGVTFDKQGVVVEGPGNLLHFRDPKVWRTGDDWFMVFGASTEDDRGQVWLYRSADMKTWEFDRVLFTDPNPDVYMLECPDLFPLGDHWVLLYGPMTHAKPHGYMSRNGHNCGYVVGDWAPGEDFVPLTDYRCADWGHNFYAAQSFLAPDQRRLVFGWMGQFTSPMRPQAHDAWSGQLAVPRTVTLTEDLRLAWTPAAELAQLRESTQDYGELELGVDETVILADDIDSCEIEATIDLAGSSAEQIGFEIHRTAVGRATWVAYDDLSGRVVLDRRTTSSDPGDGSYRSAPCEAGESLTLRILVDRGSIEVFIGDGVETLSSTSFPDDGTRSLAITSVAGTAKVTSLKVHQLGSIWQ